MRSIFTKQTLAFQDRGIESPDLGSVAPHYLLSTSRRVLLWAGVSARIEDKSRVDQAFLRLTVVGRNAVPGKLSIARMRRTVSFTSANWRTPSPTTMFEQPGGIAGPDFTPLRQVSFVPTSNEHLLEIDVTEDMQAWVMRGEPNFGWMISGDTKIAGRQAVRFATCPALDVRYSGGRTSGASVLAGVYDVLGG